MIVRSSKATVSGRAGVRADRDHDPLGADRLVRALDPHRVVVLERASPGSQPTMLRRNCSRTTAVSAAITRAARSISWLQRLLLGLLHPRRVEHVERALGELRRAPPRAASWTGSCPCGWRRRRGGRGAPRPRRACRAWRPGWRPSGRDGPEPMTRRSSSTQRHLPAKPRAADAVAAGLVRLRAAMPVAVVKLGSSVVAHDIGRAAPLRRRARVRGGRRAAPRRRRRRRRDLGRDRARHAAARAARAPARDRRAAGGQRGRPGAAVPHLRRAAARAGPPDRAGAAHVLRHERAHALPQRAPHAADAARLAHRAGDQRERHDDHGRDLLRRQRLPRRAGRGAASARSCSCCSPTRTASTPPTRGRTRRAARRGGHRPGASCATLADRPRGVAARLGRHALQGRGGRDGHRGRASRR